MGLWATLCFASVLTHSDNRRICGFATLRPNLPSANFTYPQTVIRRCKDIRVAPTQDEENLPQEVRRGEGEE